MNYDTSSPKIYNFFMSMSKPNDKKSLHIFARYPLPLRFAVPLSEKSTVSLPQRYGLSTRIVRPFYMHKYTL